MVAMVVAQPASGQQPVTFELSVPGQVVAGDRSTGVLLMNQRTSPLRVTLQLQSLRPEVAPDKLRLASPVVVLPGAGQARVMVVADGAAPGAYDGYVVAFDGGAALHRTIKVVVPATDAPRPPLQLAAVESWEVRIRRWPLPPPTLTFPLSRREAIDAATREVPRDLSQEEKNDLRVLLQTAGGRTATLEPEALVPSRGDAARLAVRFRALGLAGHGTYEGKRDKTGFRLVVSHLFVLPLAMLILGVLAAVLLHCLWGTTMERSAVRQRILDLWSLSLQIEQSAGEAHPAVARLKFTPDARSQLEALDARVVALSDASVSDLDDAAVLKELDTLRTSIESWPGVAAAATALTGALGEARKAAARGCPDPAPTDEAPALRRAQALLEDGNVRVRDIERLGGELREVTTSVGRWTDDQKLAVSIHEAVTRLSDAERLQSGAVLADFRWAWFELWTARDSTQRVGDRALAAHDALPWIAERLALAGALVGPPTVSVAYAFVPRIALEPGAKPLAAKEVRVEPLASTEAQATRRAKELRARRFWLGVSISPVAVGLSVLGELSRSYANAAWGGVFDYVAAFATGFGAQGALTLVTSLLSRALGPARITRRAA